MPPGSGLTASMTMLMVNVWKMRMNVPDRHMLMWMLVWARAIPGKVMRMLMVLVMNMRVGMHHGQVRMVVFMRFCQVQPDTQPHQRRGHPKHRSCRFTKTNHRDGGTHERGD